MARSNADAQLSAMTSSQYDTLEGLLLEGRSSAAAAIEEVRVGAEVEACVARLIAQLEEEEARERAVKIVRANAEDSEALHGAHSRLETRVAATEGPAARRAPASRRGR